MRGLLPNHGTELLSISRDVFNGQADAKSTGYCDGFLRTICFVKKCAKNGSLLSLSNPFRGWIWRLTRLRTLPVATRRPPEDRSCPLVATGAPSWLKCNHLENQRPIAVTGILVLVPPPERIPYLLWQYMTNWVGPACFHGPNGHTS